MKRLAKSLVTAVLAAVLLAMPAAAYAYVDGDYGGDGVRIRTGPYTTRTVVGLGYRGQGARLFCITRGTTINGNPWWEYHRNRTTGVTGYSSDYYMRWSGSLPSC
jgi:uncharacterized protein YraI